MDDLERNALHPLREIGRGRVQARTYLFDRHRQQRPRIDPQIVDDDTVAIDRVHRQREHGRDAPETRRVPGRHVQDRARGTHVQLLGELLLVAVVEDEIEQSRLALAYQARDRDRRVHVGQRIVRAAVLDAVSGGQVLQAETGLAALTLRPVDAIRPQCPGQADDVDHVPARVAILPLTCIGIEEVAVQAVAGHLVVEAQRVVTQRASPGPGQFVVDEAKEIGFGRTMLARVLRRDTGYQAGLGLRQQVVGGLCINDQRLADGIEIDVGAQTGELRCTIPRRRRAPGLVVVPIETRRNGHALAQATSSRRYTGSASAASTQRPSACSAAATVATSAACRRSPSWVSGAKPIACCNGVA